MSVAVRPTTASVPEFEYSDGVDRSVHYLEHGFPSPLVRWHYHDDFELHLIIRSSGKFFVGDHVGHFSPGNFVLTGPRLPHNWISQTELDEVIELRDMVMQFRMDLVPAMAAHAPELAPLLPLLDRARHGVLFNAVPQGRAEAAMRGIRDAEGAERLARFIDVLHLLAGETDYALLSTLAIRSRADQASQEKIERVTQYVSEHYAQDIDLAGMAELVGMNDSAFSRFFAKATGNGFSRFVNRVRISKACELLGDSDMPITDICFETGFNNVANFNRRFRELKNITPREYRRQSRLRHSAWLVD